MSAGSFISPVEDPGYAGAFCTHFMIRTKRTVLFDRAELNPDRTIVLDLAKRKNYAVCKL